MKKVLLTAAVVLIGGSAMAQLNVGGKAGLNYSIYGTKIDPEPDEKPESSTGLGYHFGVYAEYMFSDKIGLRPELLFSARKGDDNSSTSSTIDFFGTTTTTKVETESNNTLNYLELPVLLNYKANDNFSLQFGPGFGFLMSAKSTFDVTTTTTVTSGGQSNTTTTTSSGDSDSKEGLRGTEIGLVVGGVYELESGLNFGLRYWRGMNTLNEETEFGGTTSKTFANVIQFSIGYTFLKN